jgi:hypothetical protein
MPKIPSNTVLVVAFLSLLIGGLGMGGVGAVSAITQNVVVESSFVD